MALSAVAATKVRATTGSTITATALTATAGSGLLVGAAGYWDGNSLTTLTVTRTGDTFTNDAALAVTSAGATKNAQQISSAPNVGTGATDLVATLGSGGSGGVVFILEVAGMPSSGIRDANSPAIANGGSTTATSNSLTNVTADAIFVTMMANESGSGTSTVTKDANYTIAVGGTTMSETDGTAYPVCGFSYRIVSAVAAQTPTYTIDFINWGDQIAVYKSGTASVAATRFRLPASGTPEVSPSTQSYTHTGGTARPLPTSTEGDSSALTTTAITPDAADHIAAGDTYHFQGVSRRLAGQVYATGATAKLAIQCLEANAGNNLFIQLWIGIVGPTGTALQTLLAKTADNTELNTTIQNRFMSATTTAGYTCSGGERLVVEISVTGTPVATSGTQGHNASLRFGSNGGGGDGGENDTDTGATLNPWFELTPGLLFEVPDYGTPFGGRGQQQMRQLLAT